MSATEVLRRMLDECGIEWHDTKIGKGFITVYEHDGITWIVTEHSSGRLSVKGCVKPTQGHYDGMTPEQAIAATLGPKVTGNTSDGYHTFNELYHHRAVLFSVIVRDHRELAWKSMRHHDGTMYDGMFIVGIETPEGQATYHYDIDPYWDMFDCKELDRAPEWDGHSPADAIERIATLGRGTCHEVWLLMATDIGNGCEEVLGVYSSEGAAEAAASEGRYGYALPNVQRWEVDE